MIDAPQVRALSESRWFVPLLALLHREQGARFARMLALGLSRSMLKRTLHAMVERGWVRPNPGHGHPLRPEYLLTEAGDPLGAWCARVAAARESLGLCAADLGRWSLPAVRALLAGEPRFSGLEAALAPVTPRALSLALKQLIGAGLVRRRLEDAYPPVAVYRLTDAGARLAAATDS